MTTTTLANLKYEDRWVDLVELEIDRRVQRTKQRPLWVEELARDWDDNLADIVTVSHRSNGAMIVIDGDHRVTAKRQRTDLPQQIFCRIFEGLTFPEEGLLFVSRNPGNQPSLLEKYKVGVFTGDPRATRIDQIVHSLGYIVDGQSSANGHITAVKVLIGLDDLSLKLEAEPHLVLMTLKTIGAAWGNDHHALQGPILQGIGRLWAEYGERIDYAVLVDVLKGYKGGAFGLLTDARTLGNINSMQKSMAVAERIVTEYNKGRSRNALPNWRHKR